MSELSPLLCPRCHAQIQETDNYCHFCGKSLKPGHGFLFTHTGIILMAFILGPLALPFVWLSKAISPVAKLIYTVVLLILGIYMGYLVWHSIVTINQSLHMMTSF